MKTDSPWSINKATSNIPSEGTQLVRIETIEAGQSGENAKNPGAALLKFKGLVVKGDEDGTQVYFVRSLLPQAIGILANDLSASGLFVENDEMPPLDDPEAIAAVLNDTLGGKVFMFEIKHRDYMGQTRAEYRLVGPSNL